ncbi:hypothetical protein A3N43_04850 [Klebsiella aerogenes]|nr:hypothetical protein A3N43_04850 [Klebsiella aerogenes]
MACQRAIMKYDALRQREIDLSAPLRHRQTAALCHPLNKGRDGVNINILRTISRQPHDDGDIGRVSFAGQR